jgi:hypothetical protein
MLNLSHIRRGMGDVSTDNADLNALYSTQLANQQLNEDMAIGPSVYSGGTVQTGTPLVLGSSAVSTAVNQAGYTLSSNSTLIVAVCAILGVMIAMGKK